MTSRRPSCSTRNLLISSTHVVVLTLAAACATTHDAVPPPDRAPPAAAPVAPTVRASLTPIDDEVEAAKDIDALLAPHAAAVEARARRVVGTLAGQLDRGAAGDGESTLGNFATDAMRAETASHIGRDVDVCFQNMGGLRRNLDAGPVTEGDLVEVMPFDNAVVVFELDGAALLALLDRVAARGDPISGARFRVVDDRAQDVTVGAAPLALDGSYVVCTNDYVFEGGGDYPLARAERVVHTGVLVRDTFVAAFEKATARGEPITPTRDGRVTR